MVAFSFKQWLFLIEGRHIVEGRQIVDSSVVHSYQKAFEAGVDDLVQRTESPALRDAFASMRSYPFANQIVAALVKSGCFRRYDPEEVLQYVTFNMISPVGETGRRKQTIFDMDTNRPWDLQTGNPLQARFLWSLRRNIAGICANKVPQLAYHQRKPGTLSITSSHRDQVGGEISADEIPARSTDEERERELLDDVISVLRSQERLHPDLPLVDMFLSTMRGENTRHQRDALGRNKADRGRKVIIDTLRQWAAVENPELHRLLKRFEGFAANRPDPQSPHHRKKNASVAPATGPQTPEDLAEKDYRSIVALMERLPGKELTLALAGKYRSRMLKRPPRESDSPHPHRLASTLANAVRDGVLELQKTRAGGKLYVPGPRYGEFVAAVPVEG